AHDDGNFAEWPSGCGLFEDAARDLFGLALDVGRADQLERRVVGGAGGGDGYGGVASKCRDEFDLGIGGRVESLRPDVGDAGNTLLCDAFGRALQAARAEVQTAAGELSIDLAIDGEEGAGERRVRKMAQEQPGVAAG